MFEKAIWKLIYKEEVRIQEIYNKLVGFEEIQNESHDLIIEAMLRVFLYYCSGNQMSEEEFSKKLIDIGEKYNKYYVTSPLRTDLSKKD